MTTPPEKLCEQAGRRPRLLDLFCGAGGCSVGYSRAGWEVVGIDIARQPNYPFWFLRSDALAFLAGSNLAGHFDAIHASPPCQAYSTLHMGEHPDLYEPTREALEATGLPWVIENVPGAPFRSGITLCGGMFGLPVKRHRNFESSVLLTVEHHTCPENAMTITGHCGSTPHSRKPRTVAEARNALGIDWPMTLAETAQAIPPAYTEYVGRQLMSHFTSINQANQ